MEIPLSFFDGFGSGVPVQSHSLFREWLHPCLGWRLEAPEETKKDRLFSRDQDALDPINTPR